MQLRFLGKDPASEKDDCPSLYDVIDRNTCLVQGWRVDPATSGTLGLAEGEECVRVPYRLMSRLARSFIDPAGAAVPRTVPVDAASFLVIGRRVDDEEARAQLRVPDHENVVEVPAGIRRLLADDHGVAHH